MNESLHIRTTKHHYLVGKHMEILYKESEDEKNEIQQHSNGSDVKNAGTITTSQR